MSDELLMDADAWFAELIDRKHITIDAQAAEIERLREILRLDAADWAETYAHCLAKAATVLGPERVAGNGNHVPDISEIVDMLVARIEVLLRD